MSDARGRRRLAAVIAGLAVMASGLAASPPPVAAAPEDSDTLVFVPCDGRDTAFVRNGTVSDAEYVPALDRRRSRATSRLPRHRRLPLHPGAGPDGIIQVDPHRHGSATSSSPRSVNGDYPASSATSTATASTTSSGTPRRAGADSIWLFQPDGSHETMLVERHRRLPPVRPRQRRRRLRRRRLVRVRRRPRQHVAVRPRRRPHRSGRCTINGRYQRWSAASAASPMTATRSR